MQMKHLKKVLPAVLGVVCLLSLLAFPAWALLDAQEPYTWYTNLQQSYIHTWDFYTDEYGTDGAISGVYSTAFPVTSGTGVRASTRMPVADNQQGRTSVYVLRHGGVPETRDEEYTDSGPLVYGNKCNNSAYSGFATCLGYNYADRVIHAGQLRGPGSLHIDYTVTVLPK